MDVIIRPERADDRHAIHDITRRAFAPMPYSDGTEHILIDRFRDAGVLALSLVAELNGRVIGQVSFTPASSADGSGGRFALGPVAVEPDMQGTGVGTTLIRSGIDWLRAQQAAGCVLVGNPAYYGRFGFIPMPQLCPPGEPAQFYQMLPLADTQPASIVAFHPLFYAASEEAGDQ